MNHSILAGIAAGTVLAVGGLAGIGITATADPLPQQSLMEAGCPMPQMNIDNEAEYLANMVAHHQEAVTAAKQLQRSSRSQMRALGASIVKTQSAEIATMKTWLAAWYPGRAPSAVHHPMMRDLSALSGDALDKTFLQDMIPHHMAAVMMSEQLLDHGHPQHPPVVGFATRVRNAQHAEMLQMRQYLVEWFGDSDMCPMHGDGSPGTGSHRPGGMMGW